MCFYKSNDLLRRTKKNMYVVKTSSPMRIAENEFRSSCRNFNYIKGKKYRKNIFHILRSLSNQELTKEVYHTYSVGVSKKLVDRLILWNQQEIGVFMIPKGTLVYSNDSEIAAFGITYLGTLTKERIQLVLNQ